MPGCSLLCWVMQGAVLPRGSCQVRADEVIGSFSHEKCGTTASPLGFPSARVPAEWERTVLSPLLFSSCSQGEGPMQDLASGVVRNEGGHGVFSFTGASPKSVLLGFGGLGKLLSIGTCPGSWAWLSK